MALHYIGEEPLHKPMLSQFTIAYMGMSPSVHMLI